LSYPLDYIPGSTKYDSLIPRCVHGVYRPSFDSVRSSACEICNSEIGQSFRTTKQLEKKVRQIERLVPQIEEPEFIQTKVETEEKYFDDGDESIESDVSYPIFSSDDAALSQFGLEAKSDFEGDEQRWAD